MMMDQVFEKTLLFDFYGELLTERQKQLYQLYNLDDLSLGEISEQLNISRQGVFDALKRCDQQLHHFEDKLQLVHRFIRNKKRAMMVHELIAKLKESHNDGRLTEIEAITQAMMDDM
ncbi:conserved protein of unknown function [Petrocella atlantisensis]|uniref:UPF0122 protein PATL70BA_0057 n=1 Tax=Petrocella atlantisensis TaxID=2173034 RepID=A0A3P7NSL8_9FIRM|nr:YlxM family DNA-binding protein [Petrocella atlantisensis]VDN45895.1 conserved protein of unknown function [Petrocella atlantisensis]